MKIWNKILLCAAYPEEFMSEDDRIWMEAKVQHDGTQETDTHIFYN